MDKILLLDNILNNIGLSIFWKDKNRRFLGANKSFLDYYNFTIDDILGKNSEVLNIENLIKLADYRMYEVKKSKLSE